MSSFAEPTCEDAETRKKRSTPAREQVFQLVGEYDLFSDTEGAAYMSLPEVRDGLSCQAVYAIRSNEARLRLASLYRDTHGRSVSSQALREGMDSLEAEASRIPISVGLRTMSFEKGFAVDLGDKIWTRAIVSPGSWSITNDARPRFRREAGMRDLPRPISGGDITKLRRFLNVTDDDSFSLLLGWLVFALQPQGPYPILVLQGEHGSSKSTFARIVSRLVDPNTAQLISLPKSVRDLMVVARSRHVLAFDNVSTIDLEMKDALCRLATGAGHVTRKLYSDAETVVWNISRPIILNGIDNLLSADDLADRAISITLPFIHEARRVGEAALNKEFERIRPEALGALLDGAASALLTPQPQANANLPRMADFAHFAASAMSGFGSSYDEFLDIYKANRNEAVTRGLDADPLASAIESLLDTCCPWRGTIAELLCALRSHAVGRSPTDDFPENPRGLRSRIIRLVPALRSVGIEVTELPRTKKGYPLRIERVLSNAGERGERGELPTLLNLEKERKKRERSGDLQRAPRASSTPGEEDSESGVPHE